VGGIVAEDRVWALLPALPKAVILKDSSSIVIRDRQWDIKWA